MRTLDVFVLTRNMNETEVMTEISELSFYDKGVCFMDQSFGRGYDTKFSKEARAVIDFDVKNVHVLDQALGRANRTN